MRNVEILVQSKKCASVFASDKPWAAISVSTEPGQWPILSEENRIGLLQLAFYDVSNPSFRLTGMLDEVIFDTGRAQQVLDFVEEIWEQIDILLVHCEAGISRSAAIAAAISKIKYGDDTIYFNRFIPNRLVYHTILNAYTASF